MVPEAVLLIKVRSPSNEAGTWANLWACATISSVAEILAVRSMRIEAEYLARETNAT